MNWNSFKDKFHPSWWESIKPFIESEQCDAIYAFLKAETAKGKKIAPASINTYRAFYETPLEDLKGVIILQDPYFTFTEDGPIADGLAMGCSITKILQPTIRNFYSGIENEIYDGLNLHYIQDYDIAYLANQGILMLNTALTVEKDTPNSHKEIWKPFTTFLLENVISKTNVPVLFLGKEALNFRPLLKTNPCFHASHPASAAYTGGNWDTKGVFTEMSKAIWEQSNDSILWLHIDPPF